MLCGRAVGGHEECDEIASVQFLTCVPTLHAVKDKLGCICLQCESAEGEENENDMDTVEKEKVVQLLGNSSE